MPLPLPDLDTRNWADLVSEGTAMVPRYAPGWTDQNAHDPGITLLELFAWLAEMDIYRLNQVPPRHQLKFLELVGYPPRPPKPARTMLTFSPTAGGAFTVPAGAELQTAAGTPFRTLDDLIVAAVSIKAVLTDDGSGVLADQTGGWLGGIPLATFGTGVQAGAAFYLGFDALPATTLALGFRVKSCPLAGLARPSITHHSARIVWEIFTGVWTALIPDADDTRSLTIHGIVELPIPPGATASSPGGVAKPLFYLRCRLVAGSFDCAPMLLDVAPNSVAAEQSVPVAASFTIAAGVTATGSVPSAGGIAAFDAVIDFTGTVKSLAFLPSGTAGHPDATFFSFIPATSIGPGSMTISFAHAGTSDGTPRQRMYLPDAPVDRDSVALYTHVSGAWQLWDRRDDLDAAGRADFVFTMDATTGALSFGDGEHGRVPPLGATILGAYRQTLGSAGNVIARQITMPSGSPWNGIFLTPAITATLSQSSTNRASAAGGTDREDIDGAAGRAVEVLHAHEQLVELADLHQSSTLDQIDPAAVRAVHAPTRAVNLLDIERLALNVPGTCVARARAWAGVDAAYPCLRASGVVTVAIIPDLAVPKPLPSSGLIDAVQQYLDDRRLVCTRIVVAPPQYLTVTVTAVVALSRGARASRVQPAVLQAINAFLDPRIGGPGGFGWPFGRDVFRSEILQVIQSVPGVDHVNSLILSSDNGAAGCGNIAVCPTWLVTPGAHEVQSV